MAKHENEINKLSYNFKEQEYKGIRFRLIDRSYGNMKARRFLIIPPTGLSEGFIPERNQNVWIPIKHLNEDCIVVSSEDIDYVFRRATRQLELAGYTMPIPGYLKRRNATM